MEKVILKIHTFSQDHHEYVEAQSAADIAKPHAEHQKIWVNVQGLQHVETLEALANTFGWHPLVLEDLVNTSQRPKIRGLWKLSVYRIKAVYESTTCLRACRWIKSV